MDVFIEHLAGVCRELPWQTKWVILPTAALGHNLGERLAREGVNWANLRFTTPLEIATTTVGPALATGNTTMLDEGMGPALSLSLLLELPEDVPRYFRGVADQPGMAEALWASIQDLRLAGVSSADFSATAFASGDKHAELRAVLAAYEAHLAAKRLADAAVVLAQAVTHIEDGRIQSHDYVIEFPHACWSVLERQFLDTLPGVRLRARRVRITALQIPRRIRDLGWPVEDCEPTVASTDGQRLVHLLTPADSPPPFNDGTLEMFRAGGVEAEVEEAFRRIASAQLQLDCVEVVCAQPDVYGTLVWEKAQRYGWPITLRMGIPGTLTRPVRAVLALCDWIESNFSANHLVRMLQCGDLDPRFGEELRPAAAGRILRRSGATSGREIYGLALGAAASSDERRAQDPEIEPEHRAFHAVRAAQTRHLLDWISDLLTSIPLAGPADTVSIGNMVEACAGFVSATAAVKAVEDAAARDAVAAELAALGPLAELRRPVAFVLALLRSRLRAVRVIADRPRAGALHATMLSDAGYAGRPLTFILGLEEGRVFPSGLEDPVLLDSERARLAPDALATSKDRTTEAFYAFLQRLTSAEGNICLSFSCRDIRNGRESFPSWILLHAMKLLRPEAEVTYRELNRYLGEPISVVPTQRTMALSDAGWWLFTLRGAGPAVMPRVLEAFPSLRNGATAEQRRASIEFTAYDGFVRPAGLALDIRDDRRVVSASTLERFAACPFRHFLQYGLEIDAIEEGEPEPDVWLQPDERGQLLHAVYARFLRELRAEARRPVRNDRERLWGIATQVIEETRRRIPPPSEGVYTREVHQFRRDLDLFLNTELEQMNRTPVALELAFGYDVENDPEPLATADPVPVNVGDGLRIWLRGRIDRIDRLTDGRYEVIDYKTGRLYRDRYSGTFARGTLLQHALYSRAARELLRRIDPEPRLAGSTYYFITERGEANRVCFPADLDVSTVLRDLAEAIADGTFPQAIDDRGCGRCDYHRACAKNGVAEAAAKLESGDRALAAYRRLVAHA
ncbi:MAG: PD-(D/E)XK nuclease family protein [Bryobacterales bacterium]|nr:PD-(D/E)XK nuclease family protein [Bryobacterales bacterium]